MSTITTKLVLGTDGTVDVDASTAAFTAALTTWKAERETEQSNIATAVHAVFDQFKGARINMPALASFALQKLNAQPANFGVLEERILQFVRDNSQGEKFEDGSVANPDSIFVIQKGKQGGVARRSDMPAKA